MIWLIIKTICACGWSALTYAFEGMPADKRTLPFYGAWFGFADRSIPELVASIKTYRAEPSFHHLKDVGVEWVRAWPQRAMKLGSLAILTLTATTIAGPLLVWIL